MRWAIAENMLTLLLACGLSAGFYYYTGSAHSFWWMLLMLNMNTSIKSVRTTPSNDDGTNTPPVA